VTLERGAATVNSTVMMEKAQRMIGGVRNLPTIPEITARVAGMLDNPDADLDEVAEVLLTDQVMASRVIKIVNSPLFKPVHEIRSLKRALIYLGLHRIKEIVLTCSIIKAFEGKESVFDIRAFWRHSFGWGSSPGSSPSGSATGISKKPISAAWCTTSAKSSSATT
jgi:HD-like signal output (HDOD) protein